MFKYEGKIRELLLEYKFFEKSYLYKTFSALILKDKKICSQTKKYDIILPVPIYIKKKRIKGYNQTELIAKEIAEKYNLEYLNNILIKNRDTKTQSTLTKAQRKINVKDAFSIKDAEKIKKKNIILFDDIYTTGNTVNECCKCLKKAGVNNILILTIAKN